MHQPWKPRVSDHRCCQLNVTNSILFMHVSWAITTMCWFWWNVIKLWPQKSLFSLFLTISASVFWVFSFQTESSQWTALPLSLQQTSFWQLQRYFPRKCRDESNSSRYLRNYFPLKNIFKGLFTTVLKNAFSSCCQLHSIVSKAEILRHFYLSFCQLSAGVIDCYHGNTPT